MSSNLGSFTPDRPLGQLPQKSTGLRDIIRGYLTKDEAFQQKVVTCYTNGGVYGKRSADYIVASEYLFSYDIANGHHVVDFMKANKVTRIQVSHALNNTIREFFKIHRKTGKAVGYSDRVLKLLALQQQAEAPAAATETEPAA